MRNIFLVHNRSDENSTMSVYLHTDDSALHMQPDLFVKGNLLFSMNQALLTSDGTTQHVIVGDPKRNPSTMIPYVEGVGANASFTEISSFAQRNGTDVLLADSKHGCIRSVNRLTNATQIVAGECKRVYYGDEQVDGPLVNATFHIITDIYYYEEVIYVIESSKSTVRKVDLKLNLVSTLANETQFRDYDGPLSFTIQLDDKVLYLTTVYGLAKINLLDENFSYLTNASNSGYVDGPLRTSKWHFARNLLFIEKEILLVVDAYNSRLRIVDLTSMYVSTWCFRQLKTKKRCEYSRSPAAMALMSCTVYLGFSETIQKLQLPVWFCGKKKGLLPTSTTAIPLTNSRESISTTESRKATTSHEVEEDNDIW